MAFSDDEKVRIRRHLGFMNVSQASTFFLGVPAGMEPNYILESAMNLLLPAAETQARDVLSKCDALEQQVFDDAGALVATKVGEIGLRDDEFEKLMQRYHYFRGLLANFFGVYVNPFDHRFDGTAGAGINVGVSN